jgi:hypothetical protein
MTIEIVVKADLQNIRRTIEVLHEPHALVELCAIGGEGLVSGYYDDHGALAREAKELSDSARYFGIYITANPLKGDVVSERDVNKVYRNVGDQTKDNDAERRRWWFLDVDPVREPQTSATERQKAYAAMCLNRAITFLGTKFGFPQPVTADSGNGFYAFYAVDEPNDARTRELFTRSIKAISTACAIEGLVDREDVRAVIGEDTFNAARLVKVFGTGACKGSDTNETPYRYSMLIGVPEKIEKLTREQLEKLAVYSAPSSDLPVN